MSLNTDFLCFIVLDVEITKNNCCRMQTSANKN